MISVSIEAKTFPEPRFMQIAKQVSPQYAIIRSALFDSPGVGKRLAEIKATDGTACVRKLFAQVADINRGDHTAGDAAVAATFSPSS